MDAKRALLCYQRQQGQAKRRGIGWEITFKEWCDWWGEDIDRRGPGRDQLGMCRIWDEGPYKIGNIYKGTPKQNAATRGNMQRKNSSLSAKAALEAARDACDPVAKDDWIGDLSDDEKEIRFMTGVKMSQYGSIKSFAADKNR